MTTTEAVVTDLPKDVKDAPAMGPGMGMDYWGCFLDIDPNCLT